LLLYSFSNLLLAQTASNPFELTARLDEEVPVAVERPTAVQPDTAAAPIENPPAVTETNPFDLQRGENAVSEDTPTENTTAAEPKEAPTVETPRSPEVQLRPQGTGKPNASLLFGVILGVGILLALLFILFRSSFQHSFQSIYNENVLNKLYREQGTTIFSPLTIWYLFAWISGGIYAFLLLRYFDLGISGRFGLDMLYCVLGVSVLLFAKHFVLNFLGVVFPIDREISKYNFTIMLFGIVAGVLLLIPTILLAYGPVGIDEYVVFGSLIFLAAMVFFLYLRGLFLTNRFLRFHLFHFLLYICTVEIAPVLVLLTLGKNYWGM